MAKTALYYRNRIDKARATARSMGFDPSPDNVLITIDQGTENDPRWREVWTTDIIAAEALLNRSAIRASVSNDARTIHVYVDPSYA